MFQINGRKLVAPLVAIFAMATLVACGEDETPLETIECGEDTTLVGNECVPDVQCADNEMDFGDGRCVRIDYCGEGTLLHESSGTCVAEPDAICDSGTVEEDGECVPALVITCGEGTVVAQGECKPYDEICGEGTSQHSADDPCRPASSVCGEGTAFDVFDLVCVPLSTLQCGAGTTADDGVCIPSSEFYENLAANADLDFRVAGASGEISLKDMGELFVFVGNIDAPELVDDDLVQEEDVYVFEAEAGQWLRVGLYSLGLPEPGFLLEDMSGESYSRLSDLGAGREVIRDIFIPFDGDFELTVSNLPQMLENISPAGGDDWEYVGFIEVMDAPDASSVDLVGDTLSGNTKNLRSNFYHIEGVEEGDAFSMIFTTRPLTADGEVIIISEDFSSTILRTISGESVSFDAPSDSFYVVVDRVHAYGGLTNFSASLITGISLVNGESVEMEVTLAAGEYAGVMQFNLDSLELAASIREGSTTLISTNSLAVSNSASGDPSLYWYALTDTTVTLEVENNTGSTVEFLNVDFLTGQGDFIDDIDGSLIDYNYGGSLSQGQRHYIELDVTIDDLMAINFSGTASADLTLHDDQGQPLVSGQNALIYEFNSGTYLLSVQARGNLSGGFGLTLEESQIFEISQTSAPNLAIPDNNSSGITDTIDISSCPNIMEITVDIEITHTFRGDLIVRLTSPTGQESVLHSRSGGGTDNIYATYPFPGESGLSDGEDLLDLEGTNGSGTWELFVSDNASADTGTLDEWTLNLTCEG